MQMEWKLHLSNSENHVQIFIYFFVKININFVSTCSRSHLINYVYILYDIFLEGLYKIYYEKILADRENILRYFFT
jgi:hypothetical protein